MMHAEKPDDLNEIYPVGEKNPDSVQTRNGHPLRDLTLDNLLAGRVAASDFGITAEDCDSRPRSPNAPDARTWLRT